jgi:two-component system phosphate regulon sensor histidine kinase PhoR
MPGEWLMKTLTVSSCLIAVTAVAIGFLGSYQLAASSRLREAASFERLLDAVETLVATQPWRHPVESDPAWVQLERQLDVDILPIESLPREQPSSGKANSNSLATTASRRPIRWTASALGKTQLSSVVYVAPGRLTPADVVSEEILSEGLVAPDQPQPRLALRITRELAGDPVQVVWWSSWAAMCLMGLGLVGSALWVSSTQRRQLQGLLEPWLSSLRGKPNHSSLLPRIDSPSALESSLGIVSEIVNRLIGELYGENQRSELVLGNLQEGVLAIDDRTHVLLANNALHHLLELPPEPYLDRLLLELIRLPQVNDVAGRVLKERAACEVTVELTRPQRILRILGRPLPLDVLPEVGESQAASPSSRRMGALLTIRDETLLRRIEAVRRDFVANASHELKTPLAAIRAYAETLQLGALDDRPVAEQFVGNIIEQADRINGLVQGMLQLSRVESSIAVQFEWFDVVEAARPCIAAANAVARGKSIEIATDLPAEPLTIRCDRDGFQTILGNLLSNAVRYTSDAGQVNVAIAQQGTHCVVRVSDTGIGISPEDLERIFERFYRAAKDRSKQTGGTGLGLSIVKHLAQALGGVVQVSSQPGSGSCFEVRLPIGGR